MDWIINNWEQILAILAGILGVAKIIVNLTPTEKDNRVFEKIEKYIDKVIPNRKKGGGTH